MSQNDNIDQVEHYEEFAVHPEDFVIAIRPIEGDDKSYTILARPPLLTATEIPPWGVDAIAYYKYITNENNQFLIRRWFSELSEEDLCGTDDRSS